MCAQEVDTMPVTNINIRTDSEIKAKAQEIFTTLGFDMTTAVNLFLRQTVRMNNIPFVLTTRETVADKTQKAPKEAIRPPFEYGSMSGTVWVSDDFDAPLDDFQE